MADLGVAIQPLPNQPGQGPQFQIVVANAGPEAVFGAWLFDHFPTDLGLVQWSDGTQSGQGDLNQNLNLAVGQSITFTITGSPPPDHSIQTFIDYATVSVQPGTTDPNPDNNLATYSQQLQLLQSLNSSTYERSAAPVTLTKFDFAQNMLPPSAFSATIDWGDGMTSAADIALGQAGYYVEGSHAYAHEGVYHTTLTFDTTSGPRAYSGWMRVHDALILGPDPQGNVHFINELYDDVLQRDVDPAGMGYWLSQLSAGMDRKRVAQALLSSREHAALEVQSAFHQYLHRDADAGAMAYFSSQLAAGMALEQLDKLLVASPEYWQTRAGGSNDGFLNALWADALHRSEIDPEGLAFFDRLLSHGGTRAQVAEIAFGSLEYAQDTVEAVFMHYLNRRSGGDLADVQFVQKGGSANSLAANLIGSIEYFLIANG